MIEKLLLIGLSVIKGGGGGLTDRFLLWHLKTQLPLAQQVGCSSAEGLVIQVAGRAGTEQEELGLRGLVGVKA